MEKTIKGKKVRDGTTIKVLIKPRWGEAFWIVGEITFLKTMPLINTAGNDAAMRYVYTESQEQLESMKYGMYIRTVDIQELVVFKVVP